ncbi:MAG: hypothetical protein ACFFGZ_02585 [Candidatus Thorarchaeota archaeon]
MTDALEHQELDHQLNLETTVSIKYLAKKVQEGYYRLKRALNPIIRKNASNELREIFAQLMKACKCKNL